MTNIRYIKRNRRPKRNRGGDSLGDTGREEIKALYQSGIIGLLLGDKKKEGFGFRKWNQLNFK